MGRHHHRKGRAGRGGRAQGHAGAKRTSLKDGSSEGTTSPAPAKSAPHGDITNPVPILTTSDITVAPSASNLATDTPSTVEAAPTTTGHQLMPKGLKPPAAASRKPAEEAALVRKLESAARNGDRVPGTVGHVVSTAWFSRWCKWSGFRPPSAGGPSGRGSRATVVTPDGDAPPPGPLDSCDLVAPGDDTDAGMIPKSLVASLPRIRAGLIEGRDFVILDDAAWRELVSAHGLQGADLSRTFMQVGPSSARVELDPYELQFLVVYGEVVGTSDSASGAELGIGVSGDDVVSADTSSAPRAAVIAPVGHGGLRLDTPSSGPPSGASLGDSAKTAPPGEFSTPKSHALVTIGRFCTPANLLHIASVALGRSVSDCQIFDVGDGTKAPRELTAFMKMLSSQGVKDRGFLWLKPRQAHAANGRSAAIAVPGRIGGLGSLASPASSPGAPMLTFGSGSSSGLVLGSLNGGLFAAGSPASRGGVTPPAWAEDARSVSTRERRGLAGLSNLGNTCFMASAVQCLAHTPPLLDVFARGRYTGLLNRENPLGLRGALAEAFGALVDGLWAQRVGSVAPRKFKWHLAKFAPQFAGYQQHDAQELLAFLLDGLHEDLNRVTKKPYFEDPDGAGIPDSELAATAWKNYRARNDSPIVDEFQGLLRSRLECPECGHVSVKFDPFMYLSLPLPAETTRAVRVLVIRVPPSWRGPDTEVAIGAGSGDPRITKAGNGGAATNKDVSHDKVSTISTERVGDVTLDTAEYPVQLHALTLPIKGNVSELRNAVAASVAGNTPFLLAAWTQPPSSAINAPAAGGSLRVLDDPSTPLEDVMEARGRTSGLAAFSFPTSRFSPRVTLVVYLGLAPSEPAQADGGGGLSAVDPPALGDGASGSTMGAKGATDITNGAAQIFVNHTGDAAGLANLNGHANARALVDSDNVSNPARAGSPLQNVLDDDVGSAPPPAEDFGDGVEKAIEPASKVAFTALSEQSTRLVIVTHRSSLALPPSVFRVPSLALHLLRARTVDRNHVAIESAGSSLEEALSATLRPYGFILERPEPPKDSPTLSHRRCSVASGMDVELSDSAAVNDRESMEQGYGASKLTLPSRALTEAIDTWRTGTDSALASTEVLKSVRPSSATPSSLASTQPASFALSPASGAASANSSIPSCPSSPREIVSDDASDGELLNRSRSRSLSSMHPASGSPSRSTSRSTWRLRDHGSKFRSRSPSSPHQQSRGGANDQPHSSPTKLNHEPSDRAQASTKITGVLAGSASQPDSRSTASSSSISRDSSSSNSDSGSRSRPRPRRDPPLHLHSSSAMVLDPRPTQEPVASRPAFVLKLSSREGRVRIAPHDPDNTLANALLDPEAPLYLLADWSPAASRTLDASFAESPPRAASARAADASAVRGPPPVGLADCVSAFLKPERLDESESWYCSNCKSHVRAAKKLDLWSLPNVLVVHLKRFSYSRSSRDKLSSLVRFPLSDLDLSSALLEGAPRDKASSYDLFAVSNHYGALGGGHYTAYVRMPDDGNWYDFDDSSVTPMAPEGVATPAAYVLFYRRTGSKTDIERILREQEEYEQSKERGDDVQTGAVGDGSPAQGGHVPKTISPSPSALEGGARATLSGLGSTDRHNQAGTDDNSALSPLSTVPPVHSSYGKTNPNGILRVSENESATAAAPSYGDLIESGTLPVPGLELQVHTSFAEGPPPNTDSRSHPPISLGAASESQSCKAGGGKVTMVDGLIEAVKDHPPSGYNPGDLAMEDLL